MKDKIYYFTEKSNDILDLQDELTIEEIGMYFILKAAYFKNFGELTEANLVQRCRFYGDKEKLIQLARKLFEFKEGDLVNNSWLSQIKGIKDKSNKRKDAANARWKKGKEAEDDKPKKTQDKPKKPNGLSENKENLELQFEEFWKLYKPIHTGKGNKEKSKELFFKSIKKDTLENIAKGLERYMKHCWDKNAYTKSVEVWLRNEGWKDEYEGIAEPARGKVAELRNVFQQFLDQDDE